MALLAKVLLPAFGALGLLVLLKVVTGEPFAYFTRDPAASTGHPAYLGLFSNINVMVWGASCGILWFAARSPHRSATDPERRRFLTLAALTTTILYFDDFLQLHEEVFPKYFHIPQEMVYLLYGGWVLFFLVRFRRRVLSAEPLLLFAGIGFLGVSLLIDVAQDYVLIPAHHLFEDGSKFLGTVGWCAYFVRQSSESFRPGYHT